MSKIEMYGIPNCNTVKKAKDWMAQNDLMFTFHDYKKEGVNEALLKAWIKKVGWEILVNKKGTTWRQLADMEKAKVIDAPSAIDLMLAKSSVIKRPVIVFKNDLLVGFEEGEYEKMLLKN